MSQPKHWDERLTAEDKHKSDEYLVRNGVPQSFISRELHADLTRRERAGRIRAMLRNAPKGI